MFLSIVIPAFNASDYIKTSIKSIGKQINKDLEVIIVDDGSFDQTSVIAESILKESEIDAYQIIRKVNGGVSSARNIGLEASKGDYVIFLDADDYVDINLVQCLYQAARTDSPDIISWVFERVDGSGNNITNHFEIVQAKAGKRSGINMLKEILFEKSLYLWTGSVAYNRNFLMSKHMRYSEGCISGEDTEFILVSLALARDSIFIKQPLSYYVEREGSITNSYNVRKFDAIQALQRTGEYFKQLNNAELNKITNYVLSELTVTSYLSHYEISMKYLISSSGISINYAVDKIEKDLEIYYPKLNLYIKGLMGIHRRRSIKENIRTQLFKISPKIYFSFKKLKKTI